jgi:hypothetical protein
MVETLEIRIRKDKAWAIVDRLRENFTNATTSVDVPRNSEHSKDVLTITVKGELTAAQWFTIGVIVGGNS